MRREGHRVAARTRATTTTRARTEGDVAVVIPCSHVAASAARSRRDHCLLWARLATPAAGRWRVVHLHAPVLHDVHRLLDSRMQLDELHTTVQQRVDDVPKWSVQMYYTGALSTN